METGARDKKEATSMCAKTFRNPFPLHKLNRKRDRKRGPPPRSVPLPRKAARKGGGISRRDAS